MMVLEVEIITGSFEVKAYASRVLRELLLTVMLAHVVSENTMVYIFA